MRSGSRALAEARALLGIGALLLGAALPGCGAPEAQRAGGVPRAAPPPDVAHALPDGAPVPAPAPIPPADLLTDLVDDGSLVAGLHDADASVRLVAARGLAQRPRSAAGDALAAQVQRETDPAVLAELLFGIGQRRDAASAGTVALLLVHPSPAARAAAAAALGRIADDSRTTALLPLCADPDPGVRGAAALALFRLDGRRYTHARTVPESVLVARDEALAQLALRDADAGVRWRAIYTLAGVRGRLGLATVLELCLRDSDPLCRTFALNGLLALEKESLADGSAAAGMLDDPDERVVIAAVRALARSGDLALLAGLLGEDSAAPSALVRRVAVESFAERLAQPGVTDEERRAGSDALADVAEHDMSPMVAREAAAALVALADEGRALYFLHRLADSPDWRDRARAADALKAGPLREDATLAALLTDEAAPVQAAALAVPGATVELRHDQLLRALESEDPATLSAAAEALEPQIATGTASPTLVVAAAAALERARGFELKEARQALRKALGLPPDGEGPAPAPPGRLLDRLVALDRAARTDPTPRVLLVTSRGDITLQLDRVTAPVHVANFLELADAGCYDGLDIHRVVPDFVVQGLDPRGDGFGTGGRRVPDEFSPRPYLTGSLGMPNATEPNTGGYQIFLTHLPTPHLDGSYTRFGEVVAGMDVVEQLQIGDLVLSVRRAP